MLKIGRLIGLRRTKRYDFINTYNAVDVNYERLGFRQINGKYIDASSVVNATTLSNIQQHYAVGELPKPKLLSLLLESGSLNEVQQLISDNYAEFLEIDNHSFVISLGHKFGCFTT